MPFIEYVKALGWLSLNRSGGPKSEAKEENLKGFRSCVRELLDLRTNTPYTEGAYSHLAH